MMTMEHFEEACEAVKRVTAPTKLVYSNFFSDLTGNKVYLKPENMQVTGAYKIRGAYYKISTLSGGRFSVLSAVGLLPIAVAGIDLSALMQGAADARTDFADPALDTNACYRYAALRNILYRKGKTTEILVGYEPYELMFCEWWKQLYGESEGKDQRGIYPASVIFSTDLHSLGQYIQDGLRNLFETVIAVKTPDVLLEIPHDPANIDGLNFLSGKAMSYVNDTAMLGTLFAHNDGGVPNILLELADRSEHSLGYLIYFFERACAISGYLLGVNPFNQPGVEAYKKNMFALLGKAGYEEQRAELEARMK